MTDHMVDAEPETDEELRLAQMFQCPNPEAPHFNDTSTDLYLRFSSVSHGLGVYSTFLEVHTRVDGAWVACQLSRESDGTSVRLIEDGDKIDAAEFRTTVKDLVYHAGERIVNVACLTNHSTAVDIHQHLCERLQALRSVTPQELDKGVPAGQLTVCY